MAREPRVICCQGVRYQVVDGYRISVPTNISAGEWRGEFGTLPSIWVEKTPQRKTLVKLMNGVELADGVDLVIAMKLSEALKLAFMIAAEYESRMKEVS